MNQELKDYVIKAQNYLNDCKILQKQGGTNESIVSRAYYAMFYVAKALLISVDQEAHTHQGIVTAFGLHFVKNGILEKEMGRSLADMLNKRMIGDYETGEIIFAGEAADCILAAENFYKIGKEYLQSKGFLTA